MSEAKPNEYIIKTYPLFPRVKLNNGACYPRQPFLDTIGTFIVQFHHRKITRSISNDGIIRICPYMTNKVAAFAMTYMQDNSMKSCSSITVMPMTIMIGCDLSIRHYVFILFIFWWTSFNQRVRVSPPPDRNDSTTLPINKSNSNIFTVIPSLRYSPPLNVIHATRHFCIILAKTPFLDAAVTREASACVHPINRPCETTLTGR